jgi:hypothetical protein
MTLKHKKGKLEVHDRQSRSNTQGQGLPKKNGAGGKFVWGEPGIQEGPAVLDKGDPNYEEPQSQSQSQQETEAE